MSTGRVLDTFVLVLTIIFSFAAFFVPDVLSGSSQKRRFILGGMAFLLVALTIWQQLEAAKQQQRVDNDHKEEVASVQLKLDTSLENEKRADERQGRAEGKLDFVRRVLLKYRSYPGVPQIAAAIKEEIAPARSELAELGTDEL